MSNSLIQYEIRRERCKDTDGNFGDFLIVRINDQKKIAACATRSGAEATIRAYHCRENPHSMDLSDEDVQIIITDRKKMEIGYCLFMDTVNIEVLLKERNKRKTMNEMIEDVVEYICNLEYRKRWDEANYGRYDQPFCCTG